PSHSLASCTTSSVHTPSHATAGATTPAPTAIGEHPPLFRVLRRRPCFARIGRARLPLLLSYKEVPMPRETAIPLPTRKKAALYLRVSTDQQTEKYGLESQGAACHQYARERGYTIVAEYVEGDGIRGVSGGNTERDTLTRLLREAKQTPRPFDVLLVYDTNRLARDDFGQLCGWA